MTRQKIIIDVLFDGETLHIEAENLGDLGWKLDTLGIDTRSVPAIIKRIEVERATNYKSEG